MNVKTALILALVLVSAVPLNADEKKKKQPERALLEKMEAVPCGAKEKRYDGPRHCVGVGRYYAREHR
jgi:hypothetical protein